MLAGWCLSQGLHSDFCKYYLALSAISPLLVTMPQHWHWHWPLASALCTVTIQSKSCRTMNCGSCDQGYLGSINSHKCYQNEVSLNTYATEEPCADLYNLTDLNYSLFRVNTRVFDLAHSR